MFNLFRVGYPPYVPSVAAGMIFTASAYLLGAALNTFRYAITQDQENGPSIAGAWGAAYLIMFGKTALKSRKIGSKYFLTIVYIIEGPIAINGLVAASTVLYTSEAFETFIL